MVLILPAKIWNTHQQKKIKERAAACITKDENIMEIYLNVRYYWFYHGKNRCQ